MDLMNYELDTVRLCILNSSFKPALNDIKFAIQKFALNIYFYIILMKIFSPFIYNNNYCDFVTKNI